MAPQKRKAETYDTSDPFVADDNDNNNGTSTSTHKNNRTKPSSSSKRTKTSTSTSTETEIPPLKTDTDGTKYWELSRARRITLSTFKGKQMISIREYYEKDGSWLPGKKGITMTLDQFSALIVVLPQIEGILKGMGEEVPRPDYSGGGGIENGEDGGGEEQDEESEEEYGGDRKANIEATSDEDED